MAAFCTVQCHQTLGAPSSPQLATFVGPDHIRQVVAVVAVRFQLWEGATIRPDTPSIFITALDLKFLIRCVDEPRNRVAAAISEYFEVGMSIVGDAFIRKASCVVAVRICNGE